MPEKRTAVILAGGVGSRLKPYTVSIPKPLLPLNGKPVLDIVLAQLSLHGFERVVVSLGHLGGLIRYWLAGWEWSQIEIEYVEEAEPLGTAGALHLIRELPEYFLVMNGDLLTTFDYSEFLRYVRESGQLAGIALTSRSIAVDYGVIEIDEQGNVDRYSEKPRIKFDVSMGIYALNRETLNHLDGTYMDMPTLLSKVQEGGNCVRAFKSDCYWQDIGRLDDFQQAEEDFTRFPERFVSEERRQ